jgi:hypothetical protein
MSWEYGLRGCTVSVVCAPEFVRGAVGRSFEGLLGVRAWLCWWVYAGLVPPVSLFRGKSSRCRSIDLYPTTIDTHVPLLTTNIYLWVLSQNCGPLGCNAAFRSLLSMQISGD